MFEISGYNCKPHEINLVTYYCYIVDDKKFSKVKKLDNYNKIRNISDCETN